MAERLAPSRARAQALIAAGVVTVDGRVAEKPGLRVPGTATLAVTGDPLPWVSRAALKLVHALDTFGIDPTGLVALDLGASTGGFTEVLWQGRGRSLGGGCRARPVAPTTEGRSAGARARGLNVRALAPDDVPPPGIVVADLSFIPLATALPAALALCPAGARLVALVKPQFEVGPAAVGKGGIVRDPAAIAAARARVRAFLEASGWMVTGETESPILGGDGNAEFLVTARKR